MSLTETLELLKPVLLTADHLRCQVGSYEFATGAMQELEDPFDEDTPTASGRYLGCVPMSKEGLSGSDINELYVFARDFLPGVKIIHNSGNRFYCEHQVAA